MNYWLIKTDPETYSWEDFVKEEKTSWDGIRNYAARLHLMAMKKGDTGLIYHSGGESEICGLATVIKEHYPDPTSEEGSWVSVGLKAGKKIRRNISLAEIKKNSKLKNMKLVKISRLSVSPVTKEEFDTIIKLSLHETEDL